MDEDESEMTLPFWYLLQEALWSVDTDTESGIYVRWDESSGEALDHPSGFGEDKDAHMRAHAAQVEMAKAVYSELVRLLRGKVAFPQPGNGWSKGLFCFSAVVMVVLLMGLVLDQVEKFQVSVLLYAFHPSLYPSLSVIGIDETSVIRSSTRKPFVPYPFII